MTDIIEDEAISLDKFQVVRREFLSNVYEPSIVFDNSTVSVNTACLRKLVDVEYIRFLINPDTRKLIICPCNEDDKDAFRWCSRKNDKRIPKQISCRIFFAKLSSLMGWDPYYRYKILGRVIWNNSKLLILFDLTETEVYRCGPNESNRRDPAFPSEWKDRFGLSFEEHRKLMKTDFFEEYTVFELNG